MAVSGLAAPSQNTDSHRSPSAANKVSALVALAQQSISNRFLILFRISFGCCLLGQIWWYFSTDLIRNYYIQPTFHFTWYPLVWIKPWPGDWMYLHFFTLGVAACCVLLGFYYRVAVMVFWLGFSYVFLIDRCWYMNHYYLICLICFVAMFLPAEARLSLDAWRHPHRRSDFAPAWTLWALRAQLGLPYFYAGVAKLNADWLRGEPLRTWLAAAADDFPLIGGWFTQEWCVYTFVYGGLLLDLFAVPCLLWKKTRWLTLLALTVFHLLNSQLFHIGVFPWMMLLLTPIAFVNPQAWDRLLPRLGSSDTHFRLSRLAGATLVLFFVLQLLLPLRHWLYPGNTAFTREGHPFAWRMKLNIRDVEIDYFREDPMVSQRKPISLVPYLTAFQQRNLREPDQIVQLAHYVSKSLADSDTGLAIYVSSTVALNGRPPSPFVDPRVNLAYEPRTLGHARWIYTSPQEESP